MLEVSFRFYGQLHDFLPTSRHGRRFTHTLTGDASVKDTIEAIGVPHPEVDVILVNGRPVDFGYRLRDGDEVAVYPTFRSIDLAGVVRAGVDPPRPARFVADVHVSKLASLLRLAGFDAEVRADDAEVAGVGGAEQRIVLTRDLGVLKRSIVRHGYWIRHTDPEQQLAEVIDRFDLAGQMAPFTRCLRCNTLLVPIDAAAVAERVTPRIRAAFQQFHRCPGCDRIYWTGTHYERLARLLDRVRERARAASTGNS